MSFTNRLVFTLLLAVIMILIIRFSFSYLFQIAGEPANDTFNIVGRFAENQLTLERYNLIVTLLGKTLVISCALGLLLLICLGIKKPLIGIGAIFTGWVWTVVAIVNDSGITFENDLTLIWADFKIVHTSYLAFMFGIIIFWLLLKLTWGLGKSDDFSGSSLNISPGIEK